MTKRIVFFFQEYPDIDHITPVVDYFHHHVTDYQVEVLIIRRNQDYEQDFRIQHIRNLGITVTHIFDLYNIPKPLRQFLYRLGNSKNKICEFIGRSCIKFMPVPWISKPEFFNHFYDKMGEGLKAIVLDHKAETNNTILQMAREKNIATISLPHAADNYDNVLISEKNTDPSILRKPGGSINCDTIVTPSQVSYDDMLKRQAGTKEQLKILGCPRFSEQWNQKLNTILPKQGGLPETDKYKIVFLVPKPEKNTHNAEIFRIIEFISKIENVQLVIQPHIRGGKDLSKMSQYAFISPSNISTRELIDWSDLTLFSATSVVYDNIVQDKPALFLRRTLTNKLVLERYISSWAVDTRDELYERIEALKSGQETRTFTKEERQAVIDNLVEPKGPNVCQLYADTILETIKRYT